MSPSLDFDRVTVDEVSRHFGRRRAVSRVSFVAPVSYTHLTLPTTERV